MEREREAGVSGFRILIDAEVCQRRIGNLPRSVYELHLETGEEERLSGLPFTPTVFAVVFVVSASRTPDTSDKLKAWSETLRCIGSF